MQAPSLAFITQLSRSADAVEAAVADNCRFDQRAGPGRWARFEACLPDPGRIDYDDWGEANTLNLEKTVTVASITCPDAFLELNQAAWLAGIASNRSVVRLELVSRALGGDSGVTSLEQLQDLHTRAKSNADAARALEVFCEAWNRRKDNRPAFAAFYDEVKAEADAEDWPHALRNRLGLGHYGKEPGPDLPVALMRYSLEAVLAAQAEHKLPAAFALPTVLDGGMHEFFFPVPKSHPYGATLPLDPAQAGRLTAEILHCRIPYRPAQLWKLGWIKRGHAARGTALREARDRHLTALREECGCPEFGEPMAGRT